jgi:hypothetical protein
MFAGAMLAIAPPRRLTTDRRARTRPGFMDSLNDRWERRNDDQS